MSALGDPDEKQIAASAPPETASTAAPTPPETVPIAMSAPPETAPIAACVLGETLLAAAVSSAENQLFAAADRLESEVTDALAGKPAGAGVAKEPLVCFCRVIDYWLDSESGKLFSDMGLTRLAVEIKKDYVLASFLAWRGEFKLSYITLRSFLESYCLLLYYLNQGCDRLLYLKGKGYKLMLHRMAQKRPEPDDMHAFRRHYHLLIEESYGSSKAADKFFEEIGECYGILSKAVHGDYAGKAGASPVETYLEILRRILRICNTLSLHDLMLDATDDDLAAKVGDVLKPLSFEWKQK